MKNILGFIMAVACLGNSYFVAGQNNALSGNALLPSSLIMVTEAPLQPKDSIDEYYNSSMLLTNVVNVSAAPDFMEAIINKALNQQVKVFNPDEIYYNLLFPYEFNLKGITPEEIRRNMGERYDTIGMMNDNGEYENKVLKTDYNPAEIKTARFIEEWMFDEKKFTFEKKIRSIIPVRNYENDVMMKRSIFMMPYDNPVSYSQIAANKSQWTLVKKVQYEFFINNEYFIRNSSREGEFTDILIEKENCPFWSSYSRLKLINVIFDKLKSGEAKAYDFYDNTPLTYPQIQERMGEKRDTVEIMDEYTGNFATRVVDVQMNLTEIRSVIFDEEWYFNPTTLQLCKKVIAITPVRYYKVFDEYEEDYRKNVIGKVLFN